MRPNKAGEAMRTGPVSPVPWVQDRVCSLVFLDTEAVLCLDDKWQLGKCHVAEIARGN